jgi:tRNA pseudouridine38-40 synthase
MTGAPERRFGVLLTVAYDGAQFSGFARQKEARTIAGELDGAVRAVDGSASIVRGTSRTDAGVHALAHPVAFDTRLDIPPRGWVMALSAHLPDQIAPIAASRVVAEFDPRGHVRTKTYRYLILERPVRDPFRSGRTWRVGEWLNHEAMTAEADALVGRHDFRGFRTSADRREDTVRTIVRAELGVDPALGLTFVEIEGDRFLHRMIRIVVGALVDVGRSRLEPGAVSRALASGNRSDLGVTAPPDGLYLVRVDLDDAGEDNWPDQ